MRSVHKEIATEALGHKGFTKTYLGVNSVSFCLGGHLILFDSTPDPAAKRRCVCGQVGLNGRIDSEYSIMRSVHKEIATEALGHKGFTKTYLGVNSVSFCLGGHLILFDTSPDPAAKRRCVCGQVGLNGRIDSE